MVKRNKAKNNISAGLSFTFTNLKEKNNKLSGAVEKNLCSNNSVGVVFKGLYLSNAFVHAVYFT